MVMAIYFRLSMLVLCGNFFFLIADFSSPGMGFQGKLSSCLMVDFLATHRISL